MKPLRLLVLLVTRPLLLGGCGEKPVAEVQPVEEKVLEVKDEVKPEEPVAETKPELEGVNDDKLEERESIWYLKGSDTPYTGKSFILYDNGQKEFEGNWKDGKMDGLWSEWYENGQKKIKNNYKDGKPNGLWVNWHENGQKSGEENYKDGKAYGVKMEWHPNGQKRREAIFKDDELISEKWWNNRGKPVDSYEESFN